MAYEDLLKSVEENAREKEVELRKKADAEAGEIRARAVKQAALIRQAGIGDAMQSITAERNRLLYQVRAEGREQLIRVREEAFLRAFAEAAALLEKIRSDPGYPEIFTRLLKEAAASVGDQAFVVHVDPRDEALCTRTLAALDRPAVTISTDITTAGGVVVSLPDNSVAVSNTVESRLGRVRERRAKEIHAILSGA